MSVLHCKLLFLDSLPRTPLDFIKLVSDLSIHSLVILKG